MFILPLPVLQFFSEYPVVYHSLETYTWRMSIYQVSSRVLLRLM